MEIISKPELDRRKLRLPVRLKRVLRSGELGTYDAMELMANTINSSADGVTEVIDRFNENMEILRVNENARIENEKERVTNENARGIADAERERIAVKLNEAIDRVSYVFRKPYVLGDTVYMTPYAHIHVEDKVMVVN